jgi:hypothetical protein
MERLAIVIPYYQMPERLHELVAAIRARVRCVDYDLFVVDNGSADAYQHAEEALTICLPANIRVGLSWQIGLDYALAYDQVYGRGYGAVWCPTTTIELRGSGDPLFPLVELLRLDSLAWIVSPAYTADSPASVKEMLTTGGDWPRRVPFVEFCAPLLHVDLLRVARFLPDNTYGWGNDLHLCAQARAHGRRVYLHEGVLIYKDQNISYRMGRAPEEEVARQHAADHEKNKAMERFYGPEWRKTVFGGAA